MKTEIGDDVGRYLKLLLDFRALPETKRRRTFMEVSNYPHYENVCSNILSFYFDPSAEHGLKNLLLSAFLRVSGAADIAIPEKVSVDREYPAEDQKRIDLVIDCETFTLGIENKINHWEANDFENYARVIERLGRNKKVIKAILCLKTPDNQEMPKGGFKRYTYGQLWEQVNGMLGNYISHADPKWVTCLLDFMATTTNLAGNNMEHKQLDQFFIENNELLEQMVAERDAFLARMYEEVIMLEKMMSKVDETTKLSRPPWTWKKSCLVLEFVFQKLYTITFNLWRNPNGWELHLFAGSKSDAYLAKLIKQPALNARVTGDRVWGHRFMLARWSIETDLGEIEEALRSWMRAVIEADTAETS